MLSTPVSLFFSKKQKFKLAKTFANRRKTEDTQRQLYLQHVSQDTKLRKITYRYKKTKFCFNYY